MFHFFYKVLFTIFFFSFSLYATPTNIWKGMWGEYIDGSTTLFFPSLNPSYTIDSTNGEDTHVIATTSPLLSTINASSGYSFGITTKINSESHTGANGPNRAGFSIIVVSSDTGKSVELGFWENKIQTQNYNGSTFNFAEGVDIDTTISQSYKITVFGSAYVVYDGNGNKILGGVLRDYTGYPGGSPYETKNSLYLGDNTSSADASATISGATLDTSLVKLANLNSTTAITAISNAIYTYNNSSTVLSPSATWQISNGSTMFSNNNFVNATGAYNNGIMLKDNSILNANDLTVSSDGEGASAIYINGGGALNLTGNTTLVSVGKNGSGIYATTSSIISKDINIGSAAIPISGGVFVTGENGSGIKIDKAGIGNITLYSNSNIYAYGTDSSGIVINSASGNNYVVSNGDIQITTSKNVSTSNAGNGIDITSQSGYYYVENNGKIDSQKGMSIYVSDINSSYDLVNNGTLLNSEKSSIYLKGNNGNYNITNAGAIINNNSSGIEITGDSGEYTLKNSGTISGNIAIESSLASGSDLKITNTGNLIGQEYAILTGDSNDIVTVANGNVLGDIKLGAGNDTFLFTGGTIAGSVFMGDGDDNATISENADTSLLIKLDGGNGTDTLTFINRFQSVYTSTNNDSALGLNLTNWNVINLQNSSILVGSTVFEKENTALNLLNIDRNSTLSTTSGGATINATVKNSGLINLTDNLINTRLTVTGDYIGNNGVVALETNLQTKESDQLSITGNSVGLSYLSINNTGGQGSLTSDLVKGIEVVNVDGESTGIFSLSSTLKSGLYEYRLYQHADGNWYLTNLDGVGSDLTGFKGGNSGKALINISIGGIFGNHQAALNMFSDNEARQTAVRSPDSAFWGYYHFNKLDYDLLGGRMSSNIKTSELVIGADVVSTEQLKVGFYGGYGHASVNNKSSQIGSKSKGSVTGYGIGAYVDWQESLTEGGLSAEVLAQYNWFKNDLKDTRDNQKSSYDSQALRLNVGAGYGIVVGRNDLANWILKPQVQLGYTWLSTDDFSDASKVRYSSIDGNGAQFKLGARFYGAKTTSNLAMLPYIEANWIYNSNDGSLKANGQKIDSNIAKNLAEMKAGINGQFSQNWSSYAELNARFGKSDYRRIGAQIGMNYSF